MNSSYQPDAQVKRGNVADTYVRDGAPYEDSATTTQSKSISLNLGEIAMYYIQVQNDGNVTDNFTLTGTGSDANWWITYYSGLQNITTDVVTNTWLSPPAMVGNYIGITAYVQPITTGIGASKNSYVTAKSYANSAQKDAVKMQTMLGQLQQPDLQVSADALTWYQDGLPYDTGLTTTTTSQAVTQTTASSLEITYYIRVENDSINTNTYSITAASVGGAGTGGGWFITYYDTITRANNITAQVLNYGVGYGVTLAKGLNTTIYAVMTYDAGQIGIDVAKDIYIYANADTNTDSRDAVKCVAKTASYKPDILAKKAGAPSWSFDNTYSVNPADQAANQVIANNQTITYYYYIQNDGTYTAIGGGYTVTADAGSLGIWTVSYYDDLNKNEIINAGEPDITNLITPTGWSTGNMAVGGSKQLICLVKVVGGQRGDFRSFDIWATRQIDTKQADCARFSPYISKADILVSRDNNLWEGDNTFAPPAQITSTTTAGNTVITYYLQVQNDGSYNDSLIITATDPATTGLWITYYDAAIGGGIIPSAQNEIGGVAGENTLNGCPRPCAYGIAKSGLSRSCFVSCIAS
jgi:hypothetical protein